MSWENFLLEIEEKVAVITINRPPANTLSTKAVAELNQILDELEKSDKVRAVIITGKDREDKPEKSIFSAGADVTEFGELFSAGRAGEIIEKGQKVMSRVENFTKPTIACLNGHALGGGCELAIACHLRIMANTATIGVPEVNLGILPGYGGTTRLPRLIPRTKALELLLTGVRISAEEAENVNLVNKVVPKGEELKASLEFAKKLVATSAPLAMREIINIVVKAWEIKPEESFEIEQKAFDMLSKSKDAVEGVSAFLEKRPADFKGE